MPALKTETEALRTEIQNPTHSNGSQIKQPAIDMNAGLMPFLSEIQLLEQLFADSELAGEDIAVTQTYESSVQLLRALKRHTDEIMRSMRAARNSFSRLKTDLGTIVSRMNDYESS